MSHEEPSEIDDINGPPLPKGFGFAKESAYQIELAKLEERRSQLLKDIASHPSLKFRDLARADLSKINNSILILGEKIGYLRNAEYEARRSHVATALKTPVAQPGGVILSGAAAENVFEEKKREDEELRQIREQEDGKSLR